MSPELIVAHVNTYADGGFIADCLRWLAIDPPPTTITPLKRFEVRSDMRGITLTLYRLDLPDAHPLDALAVARAQFGPNASLPYELSATTETPKSAVAKLSTDTISDGNRVSHFMEDGLVIVLEFGRRYIGLTEVAAVRLGSAIDLSSSH